MYTFHLDGEVIIGLVDLKHIPIHKALKISNCDLMARIVSDYFRRSNGCLETMMLGGYIQLPIDDISDTL